MVSYLQRVIVVNLTLCIVEQRARYVRLRKRLANACHSARHPPPLPMDPQIMPLC